MLTSRPEQHQCTHMSVHQAVSVVSASIIMFRHSTLPKSHFPKPWSSIINNACSHQRFVYNKEILEYSIQLVHTITIGDHSFLATGLLLKFLRPEPKRETNYILRQNVHPSLIHPHEAGLLPHVQAFQVVPANFGTSLLSRGSIGTCFEAGLLGRLANALDDLPKKWIWELTSKSLIY